MRSGEQVVEELMISGRRPEEVCGDDPVLLREVQERLRRIRVLDDALEELFPDPAFEDESPGSGATAPESD
jgi:hypothetical protein